MFNRVRSVVERLPPISHYIRVESDRLNAIVEMKTQRLAMLVEEQVVKPP